MTSATTDQLEPTASASTTTPRVHRLQLGALLVLGGFVVGVLIVFAGGYGYHRDELYFLAAGDHLAWAYPDQGPLTPFLAHVMNAIAPGSLTALRIPSALMAGGTVVLTGTIARELGGSRDSQIIAAACASAASVVLFDGHLLSTSTFDLLAWSLLTWLVAHILRTGRERLWPVAGLVSGLALLNKPLIAFLLVALGAGLLTAGPRRALRSGWLWGGLVLALAMWSPWLIWQGAHGWPQLEVSSAVAHGGSVSSQPRWALVPFQFLLVSPVLAPVWIAGLVALLGRRRLRRFACFAIAWFVLVVAFTVTGGKPYYLAGMFPILLGAGAIEADAWRQRGAGRRRRTSLTCAIVLSGLVSAVIALPVLPEKQAGPVISVNPDVGETIGWMQLTRTVAGVYDRSGATAVLFTSNYGEAGALDRYGPALGLPRAYSGHDGFGYWGPPHLLPDRPGPVIVVGVGVSDVREQFTGCRLAARVDNAAGVNNDERDALIHLCSGPRRPWPQIWHSLRHLG